MPIKQSAKKFIRVTKRKAAINKKIKEAMRLSLKKINVSLKAGEIQKTKKFFLDCQQKIDKALKSGLIKKNTAGRKKSRLVKKIKALEKK